MVPQNIQNKMDLQELLTQKVFKSNHLDFVTHRQIHHWKEIGLIDEHRAYAASGMKNSFNFYEVVWIKVIVEMRSFHISNTLIKKVKNLFFDLNDTDGRITAVAEKMIQEVIIEKKIKFLMVDEKQQVTTLDKNAYLQQIDTGITTSHFCLQMDIVISKMWDLFTNEIHTNE